MSDTEGTGTHTLRPGSAVPLTAVSAAVVLYLLVDAVVRGGVTEALLLAPWPLLALWGVYVAAFASRITVDADGATVQNMLQTVRLPWARVADVKWHWQVQFDLDDGGRVRALGGPAPRRTTRRPGDPARVPASARAQFDLIVDAWQDARVAGRGGTGAAVRHGWDRPALVVVAVLVAWAIVAVLVTGGPA